MIASITGRTFAAFANMGQMIEQLHKLHESEQGEYIRYVPRLWHTIRDDLNDIEKIATELDLDATIESLHYAIAIPVYPLDTP